MTLSDHAAAQLRAIWKMVVNDDAWRTEIDHSVEAVFRSLWAIVYALPLVILHAYAEQQSAQGLDQMKEIPFVNSAPIVFVSIKTITFLIDWALSIALLVTIAKVLNISRRSADVIIGYNWIQLPMIASSLLPTLALGIPNGISVAILIALPVFVLQISLLWGVIKRGFNVDVAHAIAIIALLFLTGFIASMAIASLAVLFVGPVT